MLTHVLPTLLAQTNADPAVLAASRLPPVRSVDSVLAPYIYVFYVSFGLAYVFTPIMRRVAIYYDVIDAPDRIRKMHSEPVAYLGGVAVFMGWLGGLAVSQFLHRHRMEPGMPDHLIIKFSIVIGGCVIVALGLWDDVRRLDPWMKIAGQIGAAIFLLAEGVGTGCSSPVLNIVADYVTHFTGWECPPAVFSALVGATSSLFVITVVVGCCNASNLMDGLDGLCGGVTAIIAAGFLFVAVYLAMTGQGINTNWDGTRVVLGLALLGAVLGFVPYNFNPASIFMGDTGSMFLGFACAVMIILMAQEQPKWFLASMVMFALPVLDTALAFTRRYVNGRPLFSADRNHFHHQLVGRGFSVKQTVLIAYGLAIIFGLLGASIVFMRTRYSLAFYLVIFGSIIVAAYKMGMVHERPGVVTHKAGEMGGLANNVVASVAELEPAVVLDVRDDAAPTLAIPATRDSGAAEMACPPLVAGA